MEDSPIYALAPALLPPERLAEMQELHEAWLIYRAAHPDYPTTKESVFLELVRGHRCELLAHAAALTTRAEKAEAALEVEKAKTAMLWPVAPKQTPAHDAQ